jgi:predicted DNA-binding transcriptional regulator YafY
VALDNRATWDAQEEQTDGSLIVTMAAPDLLWAASTAMAFGPIVVVLQPEEVCRMVREWAGAVARQYTSLE